MMNIQNESDFSDLLSYLKVGTDGMRRGNIIKSKHIKRSGSHTIDVSHASAEEPTVIMHREGDTITAIEFVCSCGASTTVSLEYESQNSG